MAEGEEEGSEIANLRGPTWFIARSPLWQRDHRIRGKKMRRVEDHRNASGEGEIPEAPIYALLLSINNIPDDSYNITHEARASVSCTT